MHLAKARRPALVFVGLLATVDLCVMTITLCFSVAAAVGGCICFYLSSMHQSWRRMPLPRLPARVCGSALLLLAWIGFARDMQAVAATFVWFTLLMFICAALPYLGAWANSIRGVGR